ncbi:MAG: T9SS type A sorting domain-containing protein [Candidatus Cloacimonetes bacterium]|nr:T9SS type A sorting domain-containing protein [Candidatus Cloacimonadota bacterium]
MKAVLILVLVYISVLLTGETLVILKSDGSYLHYEVEDIIDLTFSDVSEEAIMIHKIDGVTDEIALAVVVNLEFLENGSPSILINKTDGSLYTLETDQIAYISFGEATSDLKEFEIESRIPVIITEISPNPFNPETKISFELRQSGMTTLEIFNLRGERVKTLIRKDLLSGDHQLIWKGKDENGIDVASGVYFCRIDVHGIQVTSRLLLLK